MSLRPEEEEDQGLAASRRPQARATRRDVRGGGPSPPTAPGTTTASRDPRHLCRTSCLNRTRPIGQPSLSGTAWSKIPVGATAATPPTCPHLAEEIDQPQPRAGCAKSAAADGVDNWAHLRMCLTCITSAAVIPAPSARHRALPPDRSSRSCDPARREGWRWCYIDIQLG